MFDSEKAIWAVLVALIVLFLVIWANTLGWELPDANGDCPAGTAKNVPINDDGDRCYPVRPGD